MFYIDHVNNNLFAVADTRDNVIEYITKEDIVSYKNQGVEILDWGTAQYKIKSGDINKCNYRLWQKLRRGCLEVDLEEYLKTHSIYVIANKLNTYNCSIDFSKRIRLFDYSEIDNYFLIVLWLTNGYTCFLRVTSNYDCLSHIVSDTLHFETYPSCSGYLLKRLLSEQGLDVDLSNDLVYLHAYNKNNTTVFILPHNQIGHRGSMLSLGIN